MTHKPAPQVSCTALPVLAEVWRGDIRESLHCGALVETDESGSVLYSLGDPGFVTTLRSAAKPLQAIPLLTLPGSAELGLTDEELAICCASHPGEPRHAALAASVLALSGFLPDDLVCGPAGSPPSPLRHGCSGNHAAILLAARLLGAPLEGYHLPDHPAQRLIATLIADLAGASDMLLATDGCGIPTFGLRLREMARAFARFTSAGAPWERLPLAMAAHPDLVGPAERIDVRLMRATGGRMIAKTGAEGLLCLGLANSNRGMAIKIADGSTRALGVIAIKSLLQCGWLKIGESDHPLLADLRHPKIPGSAGTSASEIRLTEWCQEESDD